MTIQNYMKHKKFREVVSKLKWKKKKLNTKETYKPLYI